MEEAAPAPTGVPGTVLGAPETVRPGAWVSGEPVGEPGEPGEPGLVVTPEGVVLAGTVGVVALGTSVPAGSVAVSPGSVLVG